jgi:hypothetical protein
MFVSNDEVLHYMLHIYAHIVGRSIFIRNEHAMHMHMQYMVYELVIM